MDAFTEQILAKAKIISDKYAELAELIAFPEIAADSRYWRKLVAEHNGIEAVAQKYRLLVDTVEEIQHYQTELNASADSETKEILATLVKEHQHKEKELTKQLNLLLIESEFDNTDAVLEVKASDSSAESIALAEGLFDMYRNYAQLAEWEFATVQQSSKFAAATVSGYGAYSKLKYECGVHKSMTSQKNGAVIVSVYVKFKNNKAPQLDEKDLRIDISHSGGPGGQNVNKVESAVRLMHLPTGIVVNCRNERSQLQNKATAFKVMQQRLEQHFEAQQQALCDAAKKKSTTKSKDKIRTYNFVTGTATDHRTDLCLSLNKVLSGEIDEFVDSAVLHHSKTILA